MSESDQLPPADREVWTPIEDGALDELLENHRHYQATRGLEGKPARFANVDLRGKSFRTVARLDLSDVDFDNARLDNVDLRDTVLRHAKLSKTRGLRLAALGGADLTGATLPDAIASFDQLDGVAEISRYVQSLFKIILATTAFALLSVLSMRDEEMIQHKESPSLTLPLIQVGVSIPTFGYVMPAILATLYLYEQIYLKELWSRLADLPAFFPDGAPLDRKAYPLSLNALIRIYSVRLTESGADLRQGYLATAVVHGPVIVAAVAFWICFLKKHDWLLTTYDIAILYGFVVCLLYMQRIAAPRLLSRRTRLTEAAPIDPLSRPNPAALDGLLSFLKALPGRLSRRVPAIPLLLGSSAIVLLFSSCAIDEAPFSLQTFGSWKWDYFCIDVNDKSLSTPRSGSTGDDPADLAGVVGANLDRIPLQRAHAFRAFLAKADLRFADLHNADLREADLRAARLNEAHLEAADLSGTDLRHADFRGAFFDSKTRFHTTGTSLDAAGLSPTRFGANLMGADFRGIHYSPRASRTTLKDLLESARNYQFAQFDAGSLSILGLPVTSISPTTAANSLQHSANLRSKTMRGYDFSDSMLQSTDFRTYDFEGSHFERARAWQSRLNNCNLRKTNFTGAFLDEVDFRGAHLAEADFQGASLRGANFEGVDLAEVKNLTVDQMKVALWDVTSRFPKPADHPGDARVKALDDLWNASQRSRDHL